ncbi:MAG: tetratricopeptide repeat protein, partial [bacterium]
AAASNSVATMATQNLQAFQHYFQGLQLYYKLDRNGVKEFEQAIAIDSTFGVAYLRLTMFSNVGGVRLDAKRIVRKGFDLINRIPEKERYLLRALAAQILHSSPHLDGYLAAIPILKEMEQRFPDDLDMLILMGESSYHTGQYAMTAEYLARVLEIDPDNRVARFHLADAYREMGDYKKLRTFIESGIAEFQWSYHNLVSLYALTDSVQAGLDRLRKKHARNPENHSIQYYIALLYMLYEQFDAAEEALDALTDSRQSFSARQKGFYGLIELCLYTGRYRKALDLADRLIEGFLEKEYIAPASNAYKYKALMMMHGRGDKEAARQQIEASRRMGNYEPNMMSYSLFLIGEYDEPAEILCDALVLLAELRVANLSTATVASTAATIKYVKCRQPASRLGAFFLRLSSIHFKLHQPPIQSTVRKRLFPARL